MLCCSHTDAELVCVCVCVCARGRIFVCVVFCQVWLMVFVVHVVEAYFLNPQIYSSKLKLHPLLSVVAPRFYPPPRPVYLALLSSLHLPHPHRVLLPTHPLLCLCTSPSFSPALASSALSLLLPTHPPSSPTSIFPLPTLYLNLPPSTSLFTPKTLLHHVVSV